MSIRDTQLYKSIISCTLLWLPNFLNQCSIFCFISMKTGANKKKSIFRTFFLVKFFVKKFPHSCNVIYKTSIKHKTSTNQQEQIPLNCFSEPYILFFTRCGICALLLYSYAFPFWIQGKQMMSAISLMKWGKISGRSW